MAFGFIVCLPAPDAFRRNTKNVDHFNDIPAIRKKLQCSLLHIIADSTVNHVVVEMQQYRSIVLIFSNFSNVCIWLQIIQEWVGIATVMVYVAEAGYGAQKSQRLSGLNYS
ncbi:hypothetical protein BT96DRAFT_1009934 [Gymnopus androsaceus JB14]|uniref:Uncharacterized protein n=1 Tax=Gymnopus androsaceus JB14 TaxID=1447944 RepID=A0A6A4GBH4_9AGAR|nr:hypothetical protein BT96DRAFT_1009934 [Gymnopus androsaceus JB14]